MYRVVIDRSLCSGFGSCADLAPKVFELEGGVATASGVGPLAMHDRFTMSWPNRTSGQ